MSNIYINEPPTNGKVLLETTVGDFDIELWSKETPKACRNFVQLCLEHYYDGTIFHRIVKGFMAQAGDPTGTGFGGESIYGAPFKDEFHQRLKFTRGGLVGMANSGPNDNGSQFFFTFEDAPDLQNKHTLFGKLTGNTRFNLSKLEECEVDKNDRPVNPPVIKKAIILANPFSDIVPRENTQRSESKDSISLKTKASAVKNYALLSFGDEACEDEEEIHTITKEINEKSTGKSSHDLTDDPLLSKDILKDPLPPPDSTVNDEHLSQDESYIDEPIETVQKDLVINKLKSLHNINIDQNMKNKGTKRKILKDDVDAQNTNDNHQVKSTDLRNIVGNGSLNSEPDVESFDSKLDSRKVYRSDLAKEAIRELKDLNKLYKEKQKTLPPKGPSREQQTLNLLTRFRETLDSHKYGEPLKEAPYSGLPEKKKPVKEISLFVEEEIESSDEEGNTQEWLSHRFVVNDEPVEDDVLEAPVILARDANLETPDQYDITDPRHPINVRKRMAGMEKGKPLALDLDIYNVPPY